MDKAQPDLVVPHELETEFFQDHVRHKRYLEKAKNSNKEVTEDWSNCGELGKGGFGVVHKQIQKTTGRYRAVKTIVKRLDTGFDYSRELLAMAILAKWPLLFVEFLGWFEGPETLYIAMEYLEEGDLTKHIGTPLSQETVQNISKQILEGLEIVHQQGMAHRDINPTNIFVVSMSPVWVKLGDFGISKRIQSQDTTTFHTRVSTPMYSAPEVLGLDSNSETSDYTNSVDIWSLGCVIYELLVGERLFASDGQVLRYFLGKWGFPNDKLQRLSTPTDAVGISLLESMLIIQPEYRPTASDALRHAWLVGLKSDNKTGRDYQDGLTWGRAGTTEGMSESKLATHGKPEKRRSDGNPITRGNTDYAPGAVAFGAKMGLPRDGDPTTPKSVICTFATTPPYAPSIEGPLIQMEPLRSQLQPHGFYVIHSRGTDLRAKESRDLPEAIHRRQTFSVEIVADQPLGQMTPWNTLQNTGSLPPSPMKPGQEFPTGGHTLPSRAASGQTLRTLQRKKSHRTSPLLIIPNLRDTAKTKTRTSFQCKTLMLDEAPAQGGAATFDRTPMPAGTVRRMLVLAGVLVIGGILSGTLMLAQTPSPGEPRPLTEPEPLVSEHGSDRRAVGTMFTRY